MGLGQSTVDKPDPATVEKLSKQSAVVADAIDARSERPYADIVDAVSGSLALIAKNAMPAEVKAKYGLTDDTVAALFALAAVPAAEVAEHLPGAATWTKDQIVAFTAWAKAKRAARKNVAVTGSAYGGAGRRYGSGSASGGCCVGGVELDNMPHYANGGASDAKKHLIDEILKIAEVEGVKLGDGSPADKLRAYWKHIEALKESRDPKGNCTRLAKRINEIYGQEIISTGDSLIACQQTSELLHSLAQGMHAEFLVVLNDVKAVIANLKVLKKTLQDAQAQLKEDLAGADIATKKKAELMMTLNDAVLLETERQLALLSGLLGQTLQGTEENLRTLLMKGDLSTHIARLKAAPTVKNFGLVDRNLHKNLVFVASLADKADAALRALGMKLADYKAADTQKKLREAMLGGLLKGDDATVQMAAAEQLSRTFDMRDKIIEGLEARKGGFDSGFHGGYSSDQVGSLQAGYASSVFGGDASDMFMVDDGKSPMARRVDAQRKLRKMIVSAFYNELNDRFKKFAGVLGAFASKVGQSIPPSDALDEFVNLLGRIKASIMYNNRIYYALIGFFGDAMSKSHKDRFVGDMRMIVNQIDVMLALPEYAESAAHLRDVKDAANGIIDLIAKYSEDVAAKFSKYGGTSVVIHPPTSFSPSSVTGGNDSGDEASDNVDGGAIGYNIGTSFSTASSSLPSSGPIGAETTYDAVTVPPAYAQGGNEDPDNIYGGALIEPEEFMLYRPPQSIGDTIERFKHQIRAATIMANIKASVADTRKFGEKQNTFIASSIVEMLRTRNTQYVNLVAKLDALTNDTGMTLDEFEAEKKAAKFILDRQYEAVRGFWPVIESLDNYMRIFTDALASDPQKVQDIGQILADVEVLNDWYDSSAGNILAGIFEQFPGSIPAGGDVPKRADSLKDVADASRHYYEIIGENPGQPIGNPYIVVNPSTGEAAYKLTQRFFRAMRALKNIFGVFVHFGRSIGSQALKGLKSPSEMYSGVVNYLVASAFTQGFGTREAINSDKIDDTKWDAQGDLSKNASDGSGTVSVGLAGGAPGAGADTGKYQLRRRFGLLMRSVQSELSGYEGVGFDLEDEYFVLMMKAVTAKILTISGVFRLFTHPGALTHKITPVRMILGGNAEDPEILPEATELYMRIPLLLQWYRELFAFDEKADNVALPHKTEPAKISMVPDIDGTFAPLVRLIFRDIRGVDSASYTDDDVRRIIREVNLVVQRKKAEHPSNLTRGVIQDLISEINRRIGIVSEDDRKAYNDDLDRYGYSTSGVADPYSGEVATEIAYLPGEGEYDPPRLTESERMLGGSIGDAPSPAAKSRLGVTQGYWKLLRRFRCDVDRLLTSEEDPVKFSDFIHAAQADLRTEQRADKRFQIIAKLIRGSDLQSRIDGMKYVMFHETVVAGLNTLSAVHTMLARFQHTAMMLDMRRLKKAAIESLAAQPADMKTFRQMLLNKLSENNVLDSTLQDNLSFLTRLIPGEPVTTGTEGLTADVDRFASSKAVALDTTTGEITGGRGDIIDLLADMKPAVILNILEKDRCSGADLEKKKKIDLFFRLLIDRQFAMKYLIESVAWLADSGLVKVSVSDSRLNMSFSGLEETIQNMFASVFRFLSVLRPRIDDSLYEKYTNKLQAGSYYWLQEALIEKIIRGREPRDGGKEYPNLSRVVRGLADTFAELTAKTEDGSAYPNLGAVTQTHYFRVFASAIFYDAEANAHSGISGSSKAKKADSAPQVIEFRTNPYEALMAGGPPDKKVLDTRFAARFKQLYVWDKEFTPNRSLLFDFNQLVAKYIQAFFDVNTSKIYLGLIEKFAGGTFSRAVSDPLRYTWPDTVPLKQTKYSGQTAIALGPADTLSVNPTTKEILSNAIIGLINSAPPANRKQYLAVGKPTRASFRANLAVDRAVAGNPAASGAITASVINAALDANPFKNDMVGSGQADQKARADLLAALILHSFEAARDADGLRNDIKAGIFSIPSTGTTTGAKFLMPGEDFATVDTSNLNVDPMSGATEKSALRHVDATDLEGQGVDIPAGGIGNLQAFGQRADADREHVLFTSLAVILRTLMTSKTASCPTCSVYVSDNVADLPNHIKESMRANLPAFCGLFSELIRRAELYKTMLSQRSVSLQRTVVNRAQAWPFALANPTPDNSENKNRLAGIIDAVIAGASTLLAASRQTLTEIGDDPKYLEIHQNSIRDYASVNGVNPFMPLSSSLVILQDPAVEDYYGFPVHNLGEPVFKIMYGMRGLVDASKKATMENVVGLADIVSLHNVTASSKVDQRDAEKYLDQFVGLLRFISGARYRGVLSHNYRMDTIGPNADSNIIDYTESALPLRSLEATGATTNKSETSLSKSEDLAQQRIKAVYAFANPIDNVVALTESSDREGRIADVVNHLHTVTTSTTNMKIQNILDLNIIPINVHSLNSSIPFATLMNYAYTCERMLINLYYGADNKNADKIIKELCGDCDGGEFSTVRSAKDALVAMLIEPYVVLSDAPRVGNDYLANAGLLKHLEGMMLGATGADGLGRPKFIADQIYGKVIFGEQYCEPHQYNEIGPQGRVASRGPLRRADLIGFMTELFAAIYKRIASPAHVGMKGGATDNDVNALAGMIAEYSYRNNRASLADYGKFISDNEGKLKRMIDDTDDNTKGVFRMSAAIVGAFVAAIGTTVAEAHSKGINAAEIVLMTNAITTALQNVTNSTGAGTITDPKGPRQTTIDGMITGASGGLTTLGTAATGLFKDILKHLGGVVSKFSVANGAFHNGTSAKLVSAVDTTMSIGTLLSRATTSTFISRQGHNPAFLRYLDEGTDNLVGDGATQQPDNANVLDSRQIKSVAVQNGNGLGSVGYLRMDTKLIRNIIFITNLLRSLRLQLSKDLFHGQPDEIRRANSAIEPRLTELFGNSVAHRRK